MYITLVLSNNDMIYINFMNDDNDERDNEEVKLKLKLHVFLMFSFPPESFA